MSEPTTPEQSAVEPMRLSVSTVNETNFGDHGERLTTVHDYVPGETVEQLVRRVFPNLAKPYLQHNPTDELVIRLVVDADGRAFDDVRHSKPTGAPL